MRRKANSRVTIQNDLLDLSMSELTEISAKDVASYPKFSRLDLSSNRITTIHPSFNNFRQIVELDLSQNELQSLPENFGNLSNLVKLELYNNKLSALPLSFGNLTKLRYLDLKNNRFPPHLSTIIGECSEAKDCQQCAKQVVSYMQQAQQRLQEETAMRKKAEEEKEARREAARLEQEKEQMRKTKKTAKEKKLAALVADRMDKPKQQQDNSSYVNTTTVTANLTLKSETRRPVPATNSSTLITKLIRILFLVTIAVVAVGFGLLYFYTRGDFTKPTINTALEVIKKDLLHFSETCSDYLKSAAVSVKHGWENTYWWLQNHGIPVCKWIWGMMKLASGDFCEVAYNSICHVFNLLGTPCTGEGSKVTTTISSGKIMKY